MSDLNECTHVTLPEIGVHPARGLIPGRYMLISKCYKRLQPEAYLDFFIVVLCVVGFVYAIRTLSVLNGRHKKREY